MHINPILHRNIPGYLRMRSSSKSWSFNRLEMKLLIHPDLNSYIQGRSISTLCLTPGTLRLAKVWWKAFNPLNKTIHFKTQISLQIRFLQASVECSIKLETSKFVPQSKPSLWKSNFWSRYSSYCSFFSIVQLCIWRQIHSEHL